MTRKPAKALAFTWHTSYDRKRSYDPCPHLQRLTHSVPLTHSYWSSTKLNTMAPQSTLQRSCAGHPKVYSQACLRTPRRPASSSSVRLDAAPELRLILTAAVHADDPPHTPQLSRPSLQQTPEGGRGLPQHLPRTSIATPVPLHTPHASSTPAEQQVPDASLMAPDGQHSPVAVEHSTGAGKASCENGV